ncbi:MAG TPA: hypothetical protein VFN22_10485 [Gemmatimonadales bacterium]|nr:hypothetical protein [Gemmatimonadales bacterium]
MSEEKSLQQRIDPWAVVEHHARQAAELAPGSLSETARLALYVAAAPGVIGATPVGRGALGLGRPSGDHEWWQVSVAGPAGSPHRSLVWNAAGTVLVQRPQATGRRMLLAAVTGGILGMGGFAGMLGAFAILPAVALAGVAAFLTRLVVPSYTPLGSWPGDERYEKVMTEMVDRYERAVTDA